MKKLHCENIISTQDIQIFRNVFKQISNDESLLANILQNEECKDIAMLLKKCFKPLFQIQSQLGHMEATIWIRNDGAAAAAFIVGRNIKAIEKEVNSDRGICSIKASIVSVIDPPEEWEVTFFFFNVLQMFFHINCTM